MSEARCDTRCDTLDRRSYRSSSWISIAFISPKPSVARRESTADPSESDPEMSIFEVSSAERDDCDDCRSPCRTAVSSASMWLVDKSTALVETGEIGETGETGVV